MGKRELFIIIAFVAVGAVAFQLTAPAPTGTSSVSLGDFFREARREMRGDPGRATFVHKAAIPVPDGLREVRIIGVSEGVKVIGDGRDAIEYEFTVNSNGPDDAAAAALAEETSLQRDDLGDAMVLLATYPRPGEQRSTIVMHVPARLAVRVESTRGSDVRDVAAVHLEGVRGDVTLASVSGAVTGTHQDGDLNITGARSGKLRLVRSKNKIAKVEGGLVLDLRDADTEITESGGALEVDQVRSDLTVADHRGAITVRGTDGSVTIRRPAGETRVDVRRAEVELLVERAVVITAITTDEPLRLILAGAPAFGLDAAVTDAGIQAADFGLKPEVMTKDARLAHDFGGTSDVHIRLRNTRGDIILRKNP